MVLQTMWAISIKVGKRFGDPKIFSFIRQKSEKENLAFRCAKGDQWVLIFTYFINYVINWPHNG